jgi:hypothetical protein
MNKESRDSFEFWFYVIYIGGQVIPIIYYILIY